MHRMKPEARPSWFVCWPMKAAICREPRKGSSMKVQDSKSGESVKVMKSFFRSQSMFRGLCIEIEFW